jgi:hypothetical protein
MSTLRSAHRATAIAVVLTPGDERTDPNTTSAISDPLSPQAPVNPAGEKVEHGTHSIAGSSFRKYVTMTENDANSTTALSRERCLESGGEVGAQVLFGAEAALQQAVS